MTEALGTPRVIGDAGLVISEPGDPGHPRRWWILSILCLSLLIIGIDNLVVQVALRDIKLDLGTSGTALPWIVDAYILPFASVLLFAGSLADRFGRRRVLLIGLISFGVALIGASLASSTTSLIVWRALQGVGAALIMPSTLAIIKQIFPDGERARAIGIWVGASSAGIPLGPLVGGLVLEQFAWGAVFLISVPVVGVALAGAVFLIPESAGPSAGGLDWIGAILSVAGLVALVYGVIAGPADGWDSMPVLGSLGVGITVLVLFVLHERRRERRGGTPMLPIGIFAERFVAGAVLAALTISFVLFGAIYLITQYLQNIGGYDALGTGLRLMPIAGVVIGGLLGSLASARLGPRLVIPSGLLIAAAGLALLATAGSGETGLVMTSLAILGVGLGTTLAPASDTILGPTPRRYAGVGSALTDTSIELGGALGIAVLGSVAATSYRGALPDLGQLPLPAQTAIQDSVTGATEAAILSPAALDLLGPAQNAFISGLGDSMTVAVAVTILVAVATAWFIPSGRPAEASSVVSAKQPITANFGQSGAIAD